MPVCSVKLCRNYVGKPYNNTKITFHRFPTDSVIASYWINIIQRSRSEHQWKPHKTSVVCSEHFSEDDLYVTKKGLRRLKNGSLPRKCLILSATETDSSTNIKQDPSASNMGIHIHNQSIEPKPSCSKESKSRKKRQLTTQAKGSHTPASSTTASTSTIITNQVVEEQMPNDMENYMQYHLTGSVSQIHMRPGCLPSKFYCQLDTKDMHTDVDRPTTVKSQRKALIDEQNEAVITMTLPKIENSPGEVVNFDHLRLRVGNAKTAASYFITRLGFAPFAESCATDERPVTSYAVKQNNIILVFESAVSDCEISDEVHAHGDFVKDVAFAVHDLDELVSAARANGAELVEPVTEESDENGVLRYAVLRTYGDNTHTLIDRSNYTGLLLPGFQASEEDPLTQILPDTNLTHIDHVEANMADGTLTESVDWYEKNLNMKRFWCVDYEKELTPYSCVKSESVINRNESVLLSFNEAAPGLRPTSKVSEFVKALGSPGVEHIALYTDDIVDTMRNLKSRGAAILSWPATYYDLIRLKLRDSGTELKESIQELQEHNILVDFDERGYMLQAFTAHLQPRPTLFVELIQRRNHRGFGAMNYKWVFQAIEVLQIKQEKE